MFRVTSLGLFMVACASGQPSADAPSTPAPSATATTDDQGALCLEDARAARTPAKDAPNKIEVRHILVRHAELKDPRGATRTPEAACLRALEALKRLQSGSGWNEVVAEYSDSKNDSLGRVAYDDLAPEFADAAFSLETGQLSYVVESDRGFHIILRRQ